MQFIVYKMKTYALYKGDEFLNLGSIKFLAEWLGVKESTIRFYSSPIYRKRTGDRGLLVIRIED